MFNPAVMASWQLFQLPLVNNAWIEQMYGNAPVSSSPTVQQKKLKSFSIADILSDDHTQIDRDIGRMANHPYYPAAQQYAEPSGKYCL